MPSYTISEIAAIVNGTLPNDLPDDYPIRHLLIDSRKVTSADNALFFCIVTQKNNGHNYIPELY